MVLDRTVPPIVHDTVDIKVPVVQSTEINGVNSHIHLEPGSGTFKIELLTKGSQLYSKTAAQAQLALKMLYEGTSTKSAGQLAEAIDSLGSFLEVTPGFDYSSISLYGLAKYFEENLRLLSEIIYRPSLSSSSLENLKNKESDKLRLNIEKGSYISSINLRKSLFGAQHAYGKHMNLTEIQELDIEEISSFHQSQTLSFDIYISGDLPKDYEKSIEEHFKQSTQQLNQKELEPHNTPIDSTHKNDKLIQSSIKIGKRLFNRNHSDYFSFIVTNELLGGFFGSRLMKNIREEKGLTYGIYSSLYPLLHDGYFLISTDVKLENQQETIDEILKEIKRLRTQTVHKEELDIVKNYMIGVFANSFSSPFASIDKFKTLNSQGITLEFYETYVSKVRNITPEAILQCSSEHLSDNSLTFSLACQ